MWADRFNDDHNNDDDDASGIHQQQQNNGIVRLYQPIMYNGGRKPDIRKLDISYIGGSASTTTNPIVCSKCHTPLPLLVQLYAPLPGQAEKSHRTYQVYACNRSSCFRSLFIPSDASEDSKRDRLCYGGKGVVVCYQFDSTPSSTTASAVVPQTATHANNQPEISWDDNNNNNSNTTADNEWGTDTILSDNVDDDLAQKLAQLEALSGTKNDKNSRPNPNTKTITTTAVANNNESQDITNTIVSFPFYEIHSVHEPPPIVQQQQRHHYNNDDDDDDDENVGESRISDDKIQAMLSKYMKEEEDEDILSTLRNAGVGSGGRGGGKSKESDERLSAEEYALFTYTDRLKRNPKQILRYVYGGIPIWSIPVLSTTELEQKQNPSSKNQSSRKNQQQKQKKNQVYGIEKLIPSCEKCNSSRTFEFQIVSSILHVLNVDKYVPENSNTNTNDAQGIQEYYTKGGMDFGNIAIYTCRNCSCQEQYCVIQDTVDESPIAPIRAIPNNNANTTTTTISTNDCMDDDGDDDDDTTMMDPNNNEMDPKYFVEDDDDDW